MAILSKREALLFSARMAAEAEPYEDLIDTMREMVVELGKQGLTVDERNYFSDGYKNKMSSLRFAWRKLFSIETKAVDMNVNKRIVEKVRKYELKVANELSYICRDAVSLIENHLIPCYTYSAEASVFYNKLSGDFYRYFVDDYGNMVDQSLGAYEACNMIDQSLGAYELALTIAKKELPISNPVRLETILNHALLQNMGQTRRAFELANNAIFEATPLLENTPRDAIHQGSHKFFQYLKDNAKLWSQYASEDRIVMLKRNVCHHEGAEVLGSCTLSPEWTFPT